MDGIRGDTKSAASSAETKPRRGWGGAVLALVVLGGLGWLGRAYVWPKLAPMFGQTASKSAARGSQVPPQPVGVATIGHGDVRIVLSALGTVTPLATVTVKTQISGQLVQIAFQEGQLVHQGDFLAQIDPRPYQVALEQAEAQLVRDQATLKGAQVDLARYRTLVAQDSIAKQTLDSQVATVGNLQGTVQLDQASIDSAKLNLTYCHIIAPVDGQVGLRQVDPGNYVQTSDTNGVVVITQMQPISVIFSVPEDGLADIIARLRSGATLSVDAYDRANLRGLATGQLATLDNQIDTTTGTLKMRALFANPDEALYPNQFVNVRLLVNTLRDAVRVPVPAVQRGEPGTYVYVITPDNTVAVRPVKLGPTDGGYTAVLSGLRPGERVVTDGTDRLREGAAVTVPAQDPQPDGQAPQGQRGPGQQGQSRSGEGRGQRQPPSAP